MKAHNKRLDHTTELKAIDYTTGRAKLVLPDSRPEFIYEELTNREIYKGSHGRTPAAVVD